MDNIAQPQSLPKVAKQIATLPNIASKRWVYRQYDCMVGTVNLSTNQPSDAAVVQIKGTDRSLALTVDCNSRYVYADPEQGTAIAVSEAARNIVCTGGKPSAITNCLNFGNPYDKGVYWQFKNAIMGMKKACEKFGTPVTGGNVSFYNQSSDGTAVYPTPTIGMVGLIEDPAHITTLNFKNEGDAIYMVGRYVDDISSSQYLAKVHGVAQSPCPHFNLDEEYALQQAISESIESGIVNSCHDISEGGLFISLLESSMASGLGVDVKTSTSARKDSYLFGESQSRAVISVSDENASKLEDVMAKNNVHFAKIGVVSGNRICIDDEDYGSIADYKVDYDTAIETQLGV
jgi:phosphoribosylformylglycinamidine synthase